MKVDLIEIIVNLTLAFFGGFVKRMADMDKQSGQKANFAYYMIGSFISMFVGIVVYFLCKNYNAAPFLTAGITALSGYMGTPVLDLLSDMTQKIIKKRI